MTDDPEARVQRILQPLSKAPAFFAVVAIAILCFCFSYRGELYKAFFAAPDRDTVPVVIADDRATTVEELDTVKRQITETSQSMMDGLNAQKDIISTQKSDFQKLADQVSTLNNQMSALNEKIDALQKAESANASRDEIRPEAARPAPPSRPHLVAVRRKPVVAAPENANPGPTPASTFPILVPQTVAPANSN